MPQVQSDSIRLFIDITRKSSLMELVTCPNSLSPVRLRIILSGGVHTWSYWRISRGLCPVWLGLIAGQREWQSSFIICCQFYQEEFSKGVGDMSPGFAELQPLVLGLAVELRPDGEGLVQAVHTPEEERNLKLHI